MYCSCKGIAFIFHSYSLQPDTSRLSRYIKPLADQMSSTKDYDQVLYNWDLLALFI